MNALTHFSAKPNHKRSLPFTNQCAVPARPVFSISVASQPPAQYVTIKASSSLSPGTSAANAAKPEYASGYPGIPDFPFQLPFSLMKCAVVTTLTATALFLGRFGLRVNPAVASPVATVNSGRQQAVSESETGKVFEEILESNPNDVQALKSLLEIRVRNKQIVQAIIILDRLMELEPNEVEWPVLKNHLYVLTGELETARNGFNQILSKDPLRVEAYHGLITAVSDEDQAETLKGIENRVLEAMSLCIDDESKNKLIDFKLLLAEIRAMQGDYEEALKFYRELAKDEPKDFRPHLCQAVIYTLLGKANEAQNHYQKVRELVPKDHPYASFLDDGFAAAKLFAAKKGMGKKPKGGAKSV
ncbi:unnamed protein product [Cuscuta campestris]|uniref:Uncharacterized protein n=1 Tax=Cuscuta campestris TaxID=132261 RepID=A0A484MAH1_9ASTE|nr:unnamed protein product [Cuscuta campestris]